MRVWMFFVLILSGAKRLVLACRPAAISTSDPVLLITGGIGRNKQGDKSTELTSVEVLTPYGVPLPCYCTVPPLPASRYDHTQDGLVACGGYGSTAVLTTCSTLTRVKSGTRTDIVPCVRQQQEHNNTNNTSTATSVVLV